MDYALLTVGSAFTVGLAEERDTALNCVIAATPEHTHKMVAIAEPVHKMAATTTLLHVIAASHESSQATVDLRESSQATVDLRESSQATVDLRESSQVTIDHQSHHVSADLPESHHVSADLPESHHVSADLPESCDDLSVTSRYSRSVLRFPSLVSSVMDAPLVSACAAGIPKPTHSSPPVPELIPLSEVLPMMGITFWCVWAAYTTTELPEVTVATMITSVTPK